MLLVSHHPTYAFFHNPYEWGAFSVDIARFSRLVRGELFERPTLVTAPEERDLRRLARHALSTGEPLAVDIETRPTDWDKEGFTGKQPKYAQLNLLGLGNCDEALSFRVRERPYLLPLAKKILADTRIPKVLQNGFWFDLPVLARAGIEVRGPIYDTRDARRAISSTSPLSLDYMASLYDDAPAWKQLNAKDFNNLSYNATDAVETARTWRGLTREQEWDTPRVQRIYEQQVKLSQICSEMHQTGILVDEQMRQWMDWALEQEYREKLAALLQEVGIPAFKGTPDHMRALIYKRHRTSSIGMFDLPDPLDSKRYTNPERMDKISVKAEHLVMELVDPACPPCLRKIIDLYWRAAEVQKARSTFVTSKKVLNAIGLDGRLRPGWNSCGTDTGRFSCSEPNVMNIEQLLRGFYVAGPGRKFVHSDKSQLELRVMSAVALDPVLQGFLDTGDVYSNDARAFFNLPADMDVKKLKPAARKQAKIIHLGAQYAAGTPTVYQQALMQDRGLSFTAVKLLHEAFLKTYAGTVRYWHEEMERVLAAGYSETRLMNRRRVYPREPAINEVVNYPIQGTAADIMNEEIIIIHEQLKKHFPAAKLVFQLHDAVDVDAPERQVGAIMRMLEDVQSRPYTINGRQWVFPVEIKAGDRWSDV